MFDGRKSCGSYKFLTRLQTHNTLAPCFSLEAAHLLFILQNCSILVPRWRLLSIVEGAKVLENAGTKRWWTLVLISVILFMFYDHV